MAITVDDRVNALVSQYKEQLALYDSHTASYEKARSGMKDYEEREEEVEAVKKSLSTSFDGVVSDIYRQQGSVMGKMEDAVKGMDHGEDISAAVTGDREQDTEEDAYGSQMHSGLQAEIARCQQETATARSSANEYIRKANACVSTMASLRSQIKSLQQDSTYTLGYIYLRTCSTISYL